MRLWPWSRPIERRAAASGYTDALVDAIQRAASGTDGERSAAATAALEAAAGAYSRAFAVAEVSPSSAATAALTPPVLALLARDLIRRGEAVHVVEVTAGGARLVPAASWDITGAHDEATWWYRCDLQGPSGNVTVRRPAAAVVHARYSIDPARPWAGLAPLEHARLTGRLLGALEDALADEAGGTRGHVLPMPAATAADDDPEDDPEDDPHAQLRADIRSLRGKTALVETTKGGYGEGKGAAPAADWKPQRLGASPPEALAILRSDAGLAVLAACGVPAELLGNVQAQAAREGWRRFLHGSVQPLAEILAAELRRKLDEPALVLSFDRLMASDLMGRARALGSMVKAGMEMAEARRLAGLFCALDQRSRSRCRIPT